MTCKDCIHFNPTEHPKPEWIGYNRCDKHTADGFQEYVGKDAEICADFTSKDGTFHDNTEHCPKCGKPVSEWGLCDECNIVTCKDCKYYNEDYKLFPPYAKCDKHSGEVINFVVKSEDDICPDFVPIEDAWESVSK